MVDMIRRRAMFLLFVLLCSVGALTSIWQISDWGDRLSVVDAHSEANELRELRHFREEGLTNHYGLGNVLYPGMYPNYGFAWFQSFRQVASGREADYTLNNSVTPEGVYTHYPPGPEYLLYAAAKLFGPEPISRLRLLPITIGWIGMIFLGLSVRQRFGSLTGWLVMAACALTPALNDGFVGLHYQGYAFALLLIEIGIAIDRGRAWLPFALLGFAQGWLSFDYVFLVCLVPLAIEGAMPRIDPGCGTRWPLAWRRATLAGASFAFSHILHFGQVWAYWGDFGVALNDFGVAAFHRAGSGMTDQITDRIALTMLALSNYLVSEHPFSTDLLQVDPDRPSQWLAFRFLGLSVGPWWLLITAVLGKQLLSRQRGVRSLPVDWLWVSLLGWLTSLTWIILMVNHSIIHQYMLYRHLFFGFFVSLLFGAVTFSRYWVTADLSSRLRDRYQNLSMSPHQ
jgi:hypothetical protein